jgi:hypothetical protein
MPTPQAIAAELRKVADGLDRVDSEINIPYAFLHFDHKTKESFLATAKVFPRPLKKDLICPEKPFAEIRLSYSSEALHLWTKVLQSLTCELVEPAKPAVYRCDPLLSEVELLEAEG